MWGPVCGGLKDFYGIGDSDFAPIVFTLEFMDEQHSRLFGERIKAIVNLIIETWCPPKFVWDVTKDRAVRQLAFPIRCMWDKVENQAF